MMRTEPSPTREHSGTQASYCLPFAMICNVSQGFPAQVAPCYNDQRRDQTAAVFNTNFLLRSHLFLSKKEKKKEKQVASDS